MLALALSASAAAAAGPKFHDVTGSVRPHRVYFDGGAVTVRFRFAAERPLNVAVRIVRRADGRVVRRFLRKDLAPGVTHHQLWGARTSAGDPAPDGHYDVLIGRPGHDLRRIGGLLLHGHVFPVRGPHGTRGPIGQFGAPRDGGRTHEGFDVVAACGTKLVAARGGRVLRAGYDPVLYGNYVLIHGRGEQRSYFYAHLRKPALVRRGDIVRTDQRIGAVGETGNARTVGCHLHFELHRHGVPYDPEPALWHWDSYS